MDYDKFSKETFDLTMSALSGRASINVELKDGVISGRHEGNNGSQFLLIASILSDLVDKFINDERFPYYDEIKEAKKGSLEDFKIVSYRIDTLDSILDSIKQVYIGLFAINEVTKFTEDKSIEELMVLLKTLEMKMTDASSFDELVKIINDLK